MTFTRFALPLILAGLGLAARAAEPPGLRLPADIRPVGYAAELTLLPGTKSFTGRIEIDVELQQPSSLFWLNAAGISIGEAAIETAGGKQTATVEQAAEDFAALHLASPIAAGSAKIRLAYTGKINEKSSAGIFQGRDGQEDYLFTQFETSDARRAFPCFDQPGFKTPWQLTLIVKKEHQAIANTPVVSESDAGGGMKRVVFARSKPLPSYLVAFAVGPFDIVEAGKAGKARVPVRIVTPKGKAQQARYAAEVTATIVDRLETYFGVPFPFEKVDNVAIPLTFGFGAMENAGMVTYAQTIILSDPALDTEQRQRNYASVAAHELAHQWFGDLVTLQWWDDTWLNEAFATWTASKIIAEWKPEWNSRLGDLGPKFGAMGQDSLVSARKIHQPIESKSDIANAFDGITYEKGSAVIRMFESWVGESRFQAGVTSYLKRYASGNARAADFLDSIAGTGQPRLTSAFSTFLDQPGVPEISASLKCDGAPRVALSQKRYLPIGSSGSNSQTWQAPVCIGYEAGGATQQECFLLDKPSAEFRLTKANSCPAYLSANHAASGYYITAYEPALLHNLLTSGAASLDAAERLTVLHDLNSLANAGDARTAEVLDAAFAFSKDPERQVVSQARNMIAGVRRLVPSNLKPKYAQFITKAFGERAAQLGWSAKPGEDPEARLQRAALVPYVAMEGSESGLASEARRLADGWLKDRKGVDPDMLGGVLNTSAYFGGRDFFDSLLAELKKIDDRRQRQLVIGALGSSRDPKVAQAAMDLVLNSGLDPREVLFLLLGPLSNPETQRMPFDFVKANYDELIQRLPTGMGQDAGAYLPFVGQALCDDGSRKEFVSFFEDRSKKFTGGPRNYNQTLEVIRLCEAQRAAHAADVEAYFARQ